MAKFIQIEVMPETISGYEARLLALDDAGVVWIQEGETWKRIGARPPDPPPPDDIAF